MNKLKAGLLRLWTLIIAFLQVFFRSLRYILGSFSYRPPQWWQKLNFKETKFARKIAAGNERFRQWRRGHQKLMWALSSVLLLSISGGSGWYYYNYVMPHPEWTTFSAQTPRTINYYDTDRTPSPVLITFSQSAADMALVGKELEKGISLSPKLKGKWVFRSDRVLAFTPEKEWLPGQTYKYSFDKRLFADSVILSSYSGEFSSEKFSISIENSEFNQHPTIPREKKGVTTLRFNYPVDPASLTSRISAKLVDEKKNSKKINYTIQYGKELVTASIHSEFLSIPERDSKLIVEMDEGVKAAVGGNGSSKITDTINVPGMFNYFKISSVETLVIRNEKFVPEHVLIINTTAAARSEDVEKYLSFQMLPKKNPSLERHSKTNDRWSSTGEVTPQVRKVLVPVKLELIPAELESSTVHTFKYTADVGRWGIVEIAKGLKSFGDYVLAETYQEVLEIPKFSRELMIMHNGSILSLNGEKKIPILSRNIEKIELMARRMRPTDLHHFLTQSSGQFQNPYFVNSWKFSEDNIAETFKDEIVVENSDPTKTNYHSFDFTKYLNSSAAGGARGVFFFSASSKTGGTTTRFIVVTDLGVISKKSVTGELQVFIQSFSSGKPVSDAKVEILALNGTSLFSERTDSRGMVKFPRLNDFTREKQPVAIIAKYENDYTFLPIDGQGRELSFHRFDVGGVQSNGEADLMQAFVFSDRGIYRPGDTANFGVIVKNLSWGPLPAGLPLEFVVSNPKGTELVKEIFTLKETMKDFSYATTEESPTGSYSAQVYVIRKGKRSDMLGAVSFKVEEFLPDRMKILATLSKQSHNGWIKGDELKAKILLSNLFGTPAQDRKITSEFRLVPGFPYAKAYPNYSFLDARKAENSYVEELSVTKTDENGEAEIELELKKFAASSYRLIFSAEGFEAEGGRSVSTSTSVYISPLDFVVGYRADGDLSYMRLDVPRKVDFIALDNSMNKTEVKTLNAQVIELKYVSVLSAQSDGTYKYQSIQKEIPVGEPKPIVIGKGGLTVDLDTSKDGSFIYLIKDKDGVEYAKIPYSVIAPSGLARGLDRNAELQISLNKTDYDKSEEIELQIRAPYTGAGLITIERGRVHSFVWFKSNSETSVQKIKIPNDLEGNGYVNVMYLRSLDSKEIFTSPLSYGVAPFTISKKSRKTDIALNVPDNIRPGDKVKIGYSASRPTSLVLYGVDEGILQVASYKLPDPLSFFFTKRALEVSTSQILDLLLPEYSIFKDASSVGGDEGSLGSMNLNPFKRRRDKPVAFWSGVMSADKTEKSFEYEVPDYFNGSIRFMAVAASEEAVGSKATNSTVRGDFVISANVPTFVAPGDEFEISAGISNTSIGSGVAKDIKLSLAVSEHFEVLSEKEKKLEIKEGSEKSEVFRLKAKKLLGSGKIHFNVEWNEKKSKSSTEVSLRPAIPYMADLKLGVVESSSEKISVDRRMHEEFSKREASVSLLPLTIADGLMNYLEKYPFGCTEQVISKAFPMLVLSGHPDFKLKTEDLRTNFETVLKTLRSRQTPQGGFGLWDSTSWSYDFPTLYGLHYLTVAKEKGMTQGNDLLERGLNFLSSGALDKSRNIHEARLWAYSIYLQSRNAIIPKKSMESLLGLLKANFKDEWRNDLTGLYLAGAYALLQKTEEGLKLIKDYKSNADGKFDWNFFYDKSIRDTQYLYIAASHYPEVLKTIEASDLQKMLAPLMRGNYNTTNSSYTILGLDAFVKATDPVDGPLIKSVQLFENWAKNHGAIALTGVMFPIGSFSDKAQNIEILNPKKLGVFYQITQAGFDVDLPKSTIQEGLEIQREYLDQDQKPLTQVKNGEEVLVRIRIRTIAQKGEMDNIAIVDLIPGGFEVVADSIRSNNLGKDVYSTLTTQSTDIREDRVLVFSRVVPTMKEYFYKIKATNVGKFVVPPAYAESMYDRTAKARGMSSEITVIK